MIEQWHMPVSGLRPDFNRRIYICQPFGYDEQPEKCYPVFYLFDGQNLFFDEDACFGKSWNLGRFMEESRAECILVGIESSPFGNDRLCEYSPFSYTEEELGTIDKRGDKTIQFILDELKPRIDSCYRTIPDREHTYIGGSSMGGLISLYAVTAYNAFFSKALCLSPSLWVHPKKVRKMLRKTSPQPHTQIYMDYGSEELGNHEHNREALIETASLLLNLGVDLTFRIEPYGTHSEASWEQRIPIFMRCLGIA